MKFLIWFLCILANSLITTIIKGSGIILGGIPTALMFAGTLWLARTLCKKWDEHKENKKTEQNATISKVQPDPEECSQIRFCRRCGERLIADSRFCRKCGTEIIKE